MSPYFHFPLDEARYLRLAELLREADMEFIEDRRESFRLFEGSPLINDVYGHLRTIRGEFPAFLRSSEGRFWFVVTVTHDAEVLGDIERVLHAEPNPVM